MPDNVTLNAERRWTPLGIEKLKELWAAKVPPRLIAATLGRPESEVRHKAVELKLQRD